MNYSTRMLALGGIALLMSVPLFAYAAVFESGEQVNLTSGATITDNVYAVGGSITSASRIMGDLYTAGGTILVSSSVSEDLVAGGGTITVTGDVGDDLRVGGGSITVQGQVAGDVLAGGGQIHLAGSRIGGDVLAGGGMVRIDAAVAGDIRVGGGEVQINSVVTGNVEVDADRLVLGPEARIAGNLTYRSPQEATLKEGATVAGTTSYEPTAGKEFGPGILLAIFSVAALIFLLMLGLGGLVFVLFFRRYAQEVVENAFGGPLMELGRGLLVLIAMPIISVLLLITVIGLPLGLLGLMLYAALIIFSWLMAPVLMGSLVYKWIYKGGYVVSWKTVLLGVLVFFIIGFVPLFGGLIQFGFMLLSLGSIARLKWHIAKSWR